MSDSFILKVNNMGAAVRKTHINGEWSVDLPRQLMDKGPCTVTVLRGRLSTTNKASFRNYSKVFCESSIPIQGSSTEVRGLANLTTGSTGFTELFDVDIEYSDDLITALGSEPPNLEYGINQVRQSYMSNQWSFRCGGLPNTISFRALAVPSGVTAWDDELPDPDPVPVPDPRSQTNWANVYLSEVLGLGVPPQIEFILSIEFDSPLR